MLLDTRHPDAQSTWCLGLPTDAEPWLPGEASGTRQSLPRPTDESQPVFDVKDQHCSPRAGRLNQRCITFFSLNPLSKAMSLSPSPMGGPWVQTSLSFQGEVQNSRLLQISAAEGLVWLCHSRATRTFPATPAVGRPQTHPAQSPFLEGSMANMAPLSRNISNGELNRSTSFTRPKISSK